MLPAASLDSGLPAAPEASRYQLYRQFFTPRELAALDSTPRLSTLSELGLLRVLIVRLLAAARAPRRGRPSLNRHLTLLTAFCAAAVTMASLARFEFKRQPSPGSMILRALAEMDPDDL